jgi:hypothetical protein
LIDSFHYIQPVVTRRLETKLTAESIEKTWRWPLPDAHSAVALHVAVSTHRTNTRTRPPDAAAQQQHVDDFLNVATAFLCCVKPIAQHAMVRLEFMAISAAWRICSREMPLDSTSSSQFAARKSAMNSSKPLVCSRMNSWSKTLPGLALFGFKHFFENAFKQRHIAVDAHRQPQFGQRRAASEYSADFLRVLETIGAGFGQRIDADDATAVARRFLQRGQHARVIGAGVLPTTKIASASSKSCSVTGAFTDADCFTQRAAARLVAHVRAVGQVVGAELAHEKLI